MNDYASLLRKYPELQNNSQIHGIYKGIVINPADPTRRGKAQVWVWGIHNDFYNMDMQMLPWAEPAWGTRGSYTPPQKWDRVWVSFECGNRDHPVYFGFWTGFPLSFGTLPYGNTTGNQVHPAGWHVNDSYPEAMVVAAAAEGQTFWFQNKLLEGVNLDASIHLEDTGGKQIRVWSFHRNAGSLVASRQPESNLYGASIRANTPVNDGSVPIVLPQAPGSLLMGHQTAQRELEAVSTTGSVDHFRQKSDVTGALASEELNMNGRISVKRQGQSNIVMLGGMLTLNGGLGSFLANMLTPPRRYND